MKFHDCSTAPTPRRARIFLAEKGIEVPTVQVDLRNGEHLKPAFRKLNPACTVPVLELDDGTAICESDAICRYFEEIQPEPPLFGRTATEKALVAMWSRRVELDGYLACMEAFRNSSPGFKDRAITGQVNEAQIPELAERGRRRLARFHDMLETRLAESRFIAGDSYTIADITAMVSVDFAARLKIGIPEANRNEQRWYDEVSKRPSAQA